MLKLVHAGISSCLACWVRGLATSEWKGVKRAKPSLLSCCISFDIVTEYAEGRKVISRQKKRSSHKVCRSCKVSHL